MADSDHPSDPLADAAATMYSRRVEEEDARVNADFAKRFAESAFNVEQRSKVLIDYFGELLENRGHYLILFIRRYEQIERFEKALDTYLDAIMQDAKERVQRFEAPQQQIFLTTLRTCLIGRMAHWKGEAMQRIRTGVSGASDGRKTETASKRETITAGTGGPRPEICFVRWGPTPDNYDVGHGCGRMGFYLDNDGIPAHEISIDRFEIRPTVWAAGQQIARIPAGGNDFVLAWLEGFFPTDPRKWDLKRAIQEAAGARGGLARDEPDYRVKVTAVYRDSRDVRYRSTAYLTYIASQDRLQFGATTHETLSVSGSSANVHKDASQEQASLVGAPEPAESSGQVDLNSPTSPGPNQVPDPGHLPPVQPNNRIGGLLIDQLKEAETRTTDPKLRKELAAVLRYERYFEDLKVIKAACSRYQTASLLEQQFRGLDVWAALTDDDKADLATGDFAPGRFAWALVRRLLNLTGNDDRTLKNYRKSLRAAGLLP